VGKQLRELDFCAPFLRAHPKIARVGYLGFLEPTSPQGRI
jgi:hypothetical protein